MFCERTLLEFSRLKQFRSRWPSVVLPSGIMGRSGTAKGGGKGSAKGGEQAKASKYVKRVDLYKFLGKWILRSYPDERGRPLMLGAGKHTAHAALEPEALRAV